MVIEKPIIRMKCINVFKEYYIRTSIKGRPMHTSFYKIVLKITQNLSVKCVCLTKAN